MAAKLKTYPKYKESGVEWLGEVPEGWEIIKLRFLSSINTGNKDTVNGVEHGTYPFFVRSPLIERINSYSYDGEAVLTAGDGVGVGKVFHYVNGKFDWHQRVYCFYNFKKIKGLYFHHYLSNLFTYEVNQGNAKSTVDSLRLPMIQNFPFCVPSEQEQITIANYLDQQTAKIDKLIENYQKLMTLLKEKRTALITHCVTKGLDSKVKMKNSGIEWLGEVPESWKVCCLKRNLRLKTQKSVFTKDEYLIALENIEGFTGKYIKTDADYSGEAVSFNPKDILFGKLRPYLAKVFHCYQHGFAFGDLLVYESKSDSRFAFYQMLSDWFIRVIDSSTYGAKMPRASSEFIGEMDITLPPLQEQTTIANHLDQQTTKIDQTLSKAKKAIELLKEKRTALITAAVTGKIDLRETVS